MKTSDIVSARGDKATKKKESKSSSDKKLIKIKDKIKAADSEQKELFHELKAVVFEEKKTVEESISLFRKGATVLRHTSFNKITTVPKPLSKLLDLEKDEKLSRSNVTIKLYAYMKENDLFDESKKHITPNSALRKALNMSKDDSLTVYNIQLRMSNVYDDIDDSSESEEVSSDDGDDK